jgi:hypothetical protein
MNSKNPLYRTLRGRFQPVGLPMPEGRLRARFQPIGFIGLQAGFRLVETTARREGRPGRAETFAIKFEASFAELVLNSGSYYKADYRP